jgi:hypothetical protein
MGMIINEKIAEAVIISANENFVPTAVPKGSLIDEIIPMMSLER